MHVSVDKDPKPLTASPAVVHGAVLGIVVLGAALRVWVAGQDLFADELATYWVVSTRGFAGVVETVSTTAEITPPLGFLLSWLTSRAGLGPELVRLPALLGGIASIPLVYAVGVRTVGRGAALLAAALTALSPFMIFYSAEARGYGVLIALLLASTLVLLIAVEDGRARWWVAYGALVCMATYTHYTAVFVLAAQLGWTLWSHPRARWPVLLSTAAAAALFLPWLPSLKGDVDSPTTDILSDFSPLNLETVRLTLGHWTIGFPFAGPGRSMSELPGAPGMLLLVASVLVGAYGVISTRSRLGPWFAARGGHIGLIALLALATPIGTALQSAVGTNVFSTRSLAASWPYLALAVSSLVTVGRPVVRLTAAALALAALAVSTVAMAGDDFRRPDYSSLAHFIDDHPGGVVIDGANFTPGPLANFDLEGSTPDAPVIRLNAPVQKRLPFAVGEPLPDPAEVAQRAVDVADGGPITVVTFVPQKAVTEELLRLLPPDYVLTDTKRTEGMFDLQALVFERQPEG